MKKLFFMLCMAGSALLATAQEGVATPVDPNAPEIKWESTDIDYGTIQQDANGAREFKFTNVGKSPLILSNCRGSCGCTVPDCPKEPIMPGQKGVIKVSYDTHRIGAFTKTVTVESNAKNNTETLKIHGTVLDSNAGAAPAVNEAAKPAPAATPAKATPAPATKTTKKADSK
jgi:hypothetical protein